MVLVADKVKQHAGQHNFFTFAKQYAAKHNIPYKDVVKSEEAKKAFREKKKPVEKKKKVKYEDEDKCSSGQTVNVYCGSSGGAPGGAPGAAGAPGAPGRAGPGGAPGGGAPPPRRQVPFPSRFGGDGGEDGGPPPPGVPRAPPSTPFRSPGVPRAPPSSTRSDVEYIGESNPTVDWVNNLTETQEKNIINLAKSPMKSARRTLDVEMGEILEDIASATEQAIQSTPQFTRQTLGGFNMDPVVRPQFTTSRLGGFNMDPVVRPQFTTSRLGGFNMDPVQPVRPQLTTSRLGGFNMDPQISPIAPLSTPVKSPTNQFETPLQQIVGPPGGDTASRTEIDNLLANSDDELDVVVGDVISMADLNESTSGSELDVVKSNLLLLENGQEAIINRLRLENFQLQHAMQEYDYRARQEAQQAAAESKQQISNAIQMLTYNQITPMQLQEFSINIQDYLKTTLLQVENSLQNSNVQIGTEILRIQNGMREMYDLQSGTKEQLLTIENTIEQQQKETSAEKEDMQTQLLRLQFPEPLQEKQRKSQTLRIENGPAGVTENKPVQSANIGGTEVPVEIPDIQGLNKLLAEEEEKQKREAGKRKRSDEPTGKRRRGEEEKKEEDPFRPDEEPFDKFAYGGYDDYDPDDTIALPAVELRPNRLFRLKDEQGKRVLNADVARQLLTTLGPEAVNYAKNMAKVYGREKPNFQENVQAIAYILRAGEAIVPANVEGLVAAAEDQDIARLVKILLNKAQTIRPAQGIGLKKKK